MAGPISRTNDIPQLYLLEHFGMSQPRQPFARPPVSTAVSPRRLATAGDPNLGSEDFDQTHHRLHGPAEHDRRRRLPDLDIHQARNRLVQGRQRLLRD
ncbi:hypothetical protein FRC00_005507, partial [Tulasnella sp. 408]